MWNRVKYFITNCSTSCISVLLSAARFGISLWHYSFRWYKMCYSTSSHILTFVTPWLPRRRRSPAEIAAGWRYRPPIKNMTAHYNSFVSAFIVVCSRKPKNASGHVKMGSKHNLVHFKSLFGCLLIKSSQHLHAQIKLRVIPSLPSHLVLHFTMVKWFRLGWQDWRGEILALLIN